ncbi:MAG: PAS domain-containing protein [Hydrogenophaga sp.]|uniref:PAS domain-containing sensor histidine kinase n=1 Tax=Hydrogenophaga sp. TaxID=1904254 RepID=UPI001D24EFB6|nr:PAS domain-containing protein [Hydrogenophaga sp.]MBX3609638.1 PAS domain-containing protein [Hydrogenophaga sp.]
MIWRTRLWAPPGRWLAPMLLALFALLATGVSYVDGLSHVQGEVEAAELRRLRERLAVEQSRLLLYSEPNGVHMVRGVVGGMGLYQGMQAAFLLADGDRIAASLVRADIDRRFQEVLAERPALAPLGSMPSVASASQAIQLWVVPGGQQITGRVPFANGRELQVLVDLSQPLAERRQVLVREVLRESLLLLLLVVLLAVVMHVIWFRRARHLSATLAALGEGRLDQRSGLRGRDELAHIGAEADRMAERLQKQQQQLQHLYALVDRSPAVVIEWANRPGWPMTYLSQNVSQWGYTAEQLLAGVVDWDDLVHPDDLVRMNTEIAAHWAAGRNEYRQEYRLRCADGHYVWIEDRTSIARRSDGEIDSISGILLDVTAQKQAELSLREQSEVQRLFYELPFIGMAISSPQSKQWLQVNDRLCEILGYSREQLLSRPWTDMTPQPDRDQNLDLLAEMLAGRTDHYAMAKRFVRGDGRIVHTEIDVRAVRLADGTLHRLFATVQDVTERRRASEALSEQKALLEQAEGLAGLGSWRFDSSDSEVWWSAQMFHNIGRDAALGPPPTLDDYIACLHPDDQAAVRAFMVSAAADEQVLHAEFRRHPELGAERWFRASMQRRRNPDGGWRSSGTLLDITPLKQAQFELQRTNEELERRVNERTEQLSEANRELEAFTYSVSHDLKAPLRGIDGYSQLLEEEYTGVLDEEAQGFIRRIRRGVQQMGTLINDLLTYSRMERRTMERQPVDLAATVRLVLEEYAADIERTQARLDVDVPELFVALDKEGLTVVLRNLVGNALKFTRPGETPLVQIGLRQDDKHHTLWVRDHGVGFDMKYHERIFGIFQRLQRAEDFPGTGVGLALVAKAMQRMGGRVWAESQPGQGATFFLEFPA